MDHEWSQLLAAALRLREQLQGDGRMQAFELSEDRRERSVKLRNARRNGGSTYLILSRGYPDRPEADADDAVWLREIGGSDRRFADPRRALEALVRQIALHTPS